MQNDRLKTLPARYGAYALVTGASEGIGQCFAEELAKAGMNVVLVARRQDRLDALARALEAQYKVLCPVIVADLSSAEQLDGLLEITDKLDMGLLVCNAGFGTAGHFLDAEIETEMNMLGVNGMAVTRLVHHFGRKFKNKGAGGVILLSSIMNLGRTASPEVVAQQSLHALGRQVLVHPGWLAKCMALALSTAPRALRVKIMSAIMASMTQRLPR